MTIAGAVLLALAAAAHVWIWVLESFLWTTPGARRTFHLDADTAAATRPLAANQGFYNLFLAVDVVVGLVLLVAGLPGPAFTALLIGAGSMVGAALVLTASQPALRRAAAVQGVLPLVGGALVLAGALSG